MLGRRIPLQRTRSLKRENALAQREKALAKEKAALKAVLHGDKAGLEGLDVDGYKEGMDVDTDGLEGLGIEGLYIEGDNDVLEGLGSDDDKAGPKGDKKAVRDALRSIGGDKALDGAMKTLDLYVGEEWAPGDDGEGI